MKCTLEKEQWEDSQKNELAFWCTQRETGNTEQIGRNGWYRSHIFPVWFAQHSFFNQMALDIGSGPRGILHTIKDASRCVAIDPLMDEFREQGYSLDSDYVESVQGSAESLPSIAYGADVVFSLNMLDHTQDPAKCLEEMYRVLRFGGTLVLCADMRPTELLDAYHKLQLTEEWLNSELKRIGFKSSSFLKPHQKGNPTVQFCAIAIKGLP